MTWLRLVYWSLGIVIGGVLFFILESLLNRKQRWWIFLIEAILNTLLGTLFAYIFMVVQDPTIVLFNFFLAVSPFFFFPLAAYDIIMMVISLFPNVKVKFLPRILIVLVLTLGYGAYGTLNSQVVTRNELTYTSEKLTRDHSFVFLSDLHYGLTQFDFVVDGALEAIKKENPEFILLGGDIVDDYSTKQNMETIFQKIGSLGIPTYYIYGNHDRQRTGLKLAPKFSPEELASAIESNGIKILCDSTALIDEDIVLLGREDATEASRKKAEELPGVPSERYLIYLDHAPFYSEEVKALSPDLQLSGHTHAGQLFPLGLMYIPAIHYVVGDYKTDSGHLYVSPGISGWFAPARTQSQCSYELIHLKKA